MSLTVYYPPLEDQAGQSRLERILDRALAGREVQVLPRAEDLKQRRYSRILFALPLDRAACWWMDRGNCIPNPPRRSWPWH